MSISTVLDGKSVNRCDRHALLEDPERVRRQEEHERRKQRLLDVREQSRCIARHIRENVAAEKQRQQLNERVAREREYNCWRDQVLAQHANDNRQAIFQVGAAQRAAQLEKEQMAARAAAKASSYQQFRKQLKARRSCGNQENRPANASCKQPLNKNTLTCTGTQTTCPLRVHCHCNQETQPQKRKRHKCAHEKSLCCCSDTSSTSDTTESISDSSDESILESMRPSCTTANTKLKQTPAVLVDVDAGSNDSVIITGPCEVQDNHVETNRQFSTVIRVSPRRCQQEEHVATQRQQDEQVPTQTAAPSIASKKPKASKNATAKTQQKKTKSPAKQSTLGGKTPPPKAAKKRYTQISDLLQRKKAAPVAAAEKLASSTSPRKARSPAPPKKLATKAPPPTPKSLTPRKSPGKSPRKTAANPSTTTAASTAVASTKSASTSAKKLNSDVVSSSLPPSKCCASVNTAVETRSIGCGSGSGISAGLVRFYDYNNKFTNCYPPLGNAERESQLSERQGLNAMEQACMEKQMRECREQEINVMQKRTEERGQIAMERERVRRDCLELTEKLDTLMQQYPNLLPSDANLRPAYLAAKACARREEKSSKAVEDILLRPAIITCPEVNTKSKAASRNKPSTSAPRRSLAYEINLGSMPTTTKSAANDKDNVDFTANSSDSCCSILLGYVNDQSQQLRNDINKCGSNPKGATSDKADRLQNLLKRIECLRDMLLKEIEKAGNAASDGVQGAGTRIADMEQAIASLSSLRNERENILQNDVPHGNEKTTSDPQPPQTMAGEDREKVLQQKEAMLEQKLQEFFKMQKKQRGSQDVQHKLEAGCTSKPLEIIIKVKGDARLHKASSSSSSSNTKLKKSPRKVPGLIQSPKDVKTHKKKSKSTAPQHSSDSTSTSYLSLPPALSNGVDALLQGLTSKPKSQQLPTNEDRGNIDIQRQKTRANINPVLAHYVQRLLGMSRSCVEALNVSSSDVQTPSSSIINMTGNRSAISVDQKTTEDEMGLSAERILHVERFIEENRSFISQLEDTMRQQTTECLEQSMRAFEEVWKKRLCKTQEARKLQNTQQKHKNKEKQSSKDEVQSAEGSKTLKSNRVGSKEHASDHVIPSQSAIQSVRKQSSNSPKSSAKRLTITPTGSTGEQQPSISTVQQSKEAMRRQQSNISRGSEDKTQTVIATRSKDAPKGADETSAVDNNGDERIVRYEQLTTNCTQRIAELTALINRVREEKQRLVEVTLSSVSDNERHSTEYMELPDDKNGKAVENATGGATLEKNKPTGRSHDSGISSRPMTSLEQHSEGAGGGGGGAAEPSSITSTHTVSSSGSQQKANKVRPPPTLRRFSPQLSLEDDVAHELSTILEIDTPGTTRVSNSTTNNNNNEFGSRSKFATGTGAAAPVAFPTFEEYARQLNLDITQMDAEQSVRIQHEFDELIANIKLVENDKDFNYEEFPSMTTYMQNVSPEEEAAQRHKRVVDPTPPAPPPSETSADAVDELLACLRLANLTIKSFPSRKEYMAQLAAQNPDAVADAIDSTSLENISTLRVTTTTNDSETESTLNIEAELKQRNILKNSFVRIEPDAVGPETAKGNVVNSTIRSGSGETSRMCAQLLGSESGIDKLSSSASESTSGDLERELLTIGLKWPTTMRRKCQEAEVRAQCSSTSPASQPFCPEPHRPPQRRPQENRKLTFDEHVNDCTSGNVSRPINLREFLTRELLKHTSTSCSTSSGTDDTLKSNFLNSIIGSITPSCTPPPPSCAPQPCRPPRSSSSNGGCRQKTSTPVNTQSPSSRDRDRDITCQTSSTTTQLFSGESRLSSVHCDCGCPDKCEHISPQRRQQYQPDCDM